MGHLILPANPLGIVVLPAESNVFFAVSENCRQQSLSQPAGPGGNGLAAGSSEEKVTGTSRLVLSHNEGEESFVSGCTWRYRFGLHYASEDRDATPRRKLGPIAGVSTGQVRRHAEADMVKAAPAFCPVIFFVVKSAAYYLLWSVAQLL